MSVDWPHVVCIFVCLLPGAWSAHHAVTSTLRLSRLVSFEKALLQSARGLDLPPQLRSFVNETEAEYASYGSEEYVSFPVHQYRLIRRFSADWPFWKKTVETSIPDLFRRYNELSLQHGQVDQFPAIEKSLAAHSLSYIHLFYGEESGLLTAKDGPVLTELEMLELSDITFSYVVKDEEESGEEDNEMFAQHWLRLFLDRSVRVMPQALPKDRIVHFLRFASDWQDLARAPVLLRVLALLEKRPEDLTAFRRDEAIAMVTKSCRAPDRSNGSFYCFLFHSPRARYMAFHFEILSLRPYVALVHNFLSPGTANRIIQAATASHQLKVTGVLEDDGTTTTDLTARLGEYVFLSPSGPENIWLDRRVQEATLLQSDSREGLDLPDGEPAQVVNYGIGGFYREHHDFLRHNGSSGDRLATVLVYLSDVHSGGATVFPELRLGVAPRVGRALLWFNLDPEMGTPLNLTLHAACPMNRGTKWIVTKWVRDHCRTGVARPVLS